MVLITFPINVVGNIKNVMKKVSLRRLPDSTRRCTFYFFAVFVLFDTPVICVFARRSIAHWLLIRLIAFIFVFLILDTYYVSILCC